MSRKSIGLVACGLLLLAAAVAAILGAGLHKPSGDSPRARLPRRGPHTDHARMVSGPFQTPQDVTRACLGCHPRAAGEVMATSHWTWISDEASAPGMAQPLPVGKKNVINNFCISIEGNEPRCTSCHAGYGWRDASFDFANKANIDCLVCHDLSGAYRKDPEGAGLPAKDVDLLAAARSVGRPTRRNCGSCHFAGGGGDAIKHGDLDGTLAFPAERNDVHMGRYQMECTDCHRTQEHRIRGRLLSMSNRRELDVHCTDCHSAAPHRDSRLNAHTGALSCQACHVPYFAVETPTKATWDWSQAGQDRPGGDTHTYLKKKGAFTYETKAVPEYFWFDGRVALHVPGQRIDPARVIELNLPLGEPQSAEARIWPFKVHRGKQVYDTELKHLLVPRLVGPGGYWTDFDWDKALRLGAASSRIPYSGNYGFAATASYWPETHMVPPKEHALRCTACHGAQGRLDWRRLGYEGDPAFGAGGGAESAGPAGGGAK